MKRRRFLQSLAAAFALPAAPAVSLAPASAAVPAAVAVPTKARFWAIYMSGLHGECTPKTLQNLLHIPEVDAKRYIGQLVADGVLKPNPLLQRSVSRVLSSGEDSLADKVKKRLEKKRHAQELKPADLARAEDDEVLEEVAIEEAEENSEKDTSAYAADKSSEAPTLAGRQAKRSREAESADVLAENIKASAQDRQG